MKGKEERGVGLPSRLAVSHTQSKVADGKGWDGMVSPFGGRRVRMLIGAIFENKRERDAVVDR